MKLFLIIPDRVQKKEEETKAFMKVETFHMQRREYTYIYIYTYIYFHCASVGLNSVREGVN